MLRFIIAIIWTTGPKAGTLSLKTVKADSLEALEFTHSVGSTWSEEDGESFRVAAHPTVADWGSKMELNVTVPEAAVIERLLLISCLTADAVFPRSEDDEPLPTETASVVKLASTMLTYNVTLSDEVVYPSGSNECVFEGGEKYWVLARYTATDENGVASKICFAT